MESLESLKQRKQQLENELEKITIKQHGSTPWSPGVQDQYKSTSYSYDSYTDPKKAYQLKDEIAYLTRQINTYAEQAREERAREEFLIESQTPKFNYNAGGNEEVTKNPAIAARYDAQQRLYGMGKLKQTMMTVTGQKAKFKKLWDKANTPNKQVQEQVAEQLNGMFR